MPSKRYQNIKTNEIVTAWQYDGSILAPYDLKIPRFVWKAISSKKLMRNYDGNLIVESKFVKPECWVTDKLEVFTDFYFKTNYEFFA